MNVYRLLHSPMLMLLILSACDSQAPQKQTTNSRSMDQQLDMHSQEDMQADTLLIDQAFVPVDMASLPIGQGFGESHAILENHEDSYYFEITETKAVLLETSLDGQGNCPSTLDTILTLYAYVDGQRVEPLIVYNDDQDVLAGKFCSRIAQELTPGFYEAVVNGYRKAPIDQYVLSISYPLAAHIGEACDETYICVNQSACNPADQKCISIAPQISAATAYLDLDTQRFYLSATAQDFDLDSGILQEVQFLDQNQNILYQMEPTLLQLFKTNEFSFQITQDLIGVDLSHATQIRFQLRDFSEHLSDFFEVELLPLPVLSLNDQCQIDQFTGKCDVTTLCISPQNDLLGTCLVNHPPVITANQSFAYANDIVMILKLNGSDSENNIQQVGVRYFDVNHMPVLVDQLEESILPIYQRRGNDLYVAQLLFDQYPQVTEVIVRLIDTGDESSDAISLPVTPQPVINLGEPCDAYILENDCGAYVCDTIKDPNTGAPINAQGICRDIAPSITQAIAVRVGADLWLKVVGIDQDQNVLKLGFNAIDAQNQIIPVMNSLSPLYFSPTQIIYDQINPNQFSAAIKVNNVFTDIPNIASLEVYALDQSSYQSHLFVTPISQRASVVLGQACDPLRVENICTQGLACENQQCTVPVPPQIQEASFVLNDQVMPHVLVLKTTITIGSSPLDPEVYFIPKNAQNVLVSLIPNVNRFILKNPIIEDAQGQALTLYFVLDHMLIDQITQMELWVRDSNEIESAHRSISISPLFMLNQNDICDRNGILGACSAGLSCGDHDQSNQTAMRCMPSP
jgi:hypothetical protein